MIVNDFVVKIKLNLESLNSGLKNAQDRIKIFNREVNQPLELLFNTNKAEQVLQNYQNKVKSFWQDFDNTGKRFGLIDSEADEKALSVLKKKISQTEIKIKAEADLRESYASIQQFKRQIQDFKAILRIDPDDQEAQESLKHLEHKLEILEQEHKVKVSGDKLSQLEQELNQIEAKKVQINGDSLRIKIDASGIKGFINQLAQIGWAIQGIKGTFEALGGITKPFVAPSAQMEAYQTSFEVMLGSAEKAKDRLAELTEFARVTPFELPEVIDAGKKLEALGLHSEETLRKLGDLASGAGKPFEQALSAFSKLASGQKGIAVDMFRDLLISVDDWKKAGIQFNDSTGEMISGTQEALLALNQIVENKHFDGMMEKQSRTLNGILSNLKDSWEGFLRAVGSSGLFDVIKGQMQDLLDWINNNQETISYFAKITGEAFVFVIKSISNLLGFIREHYKSILLFGAGIGSWVFAIKANIIQMEIMALRLKTQIFLTNAMNTTQMALNATMKANPYLLLGGGLLALGGIALMFTKRNQALSKSTNEVNTGIRKQGYEFELLSSRYERLREKEKLSNQEKTELKNIITELNSKYGKYLNQIDLSTAKYKEYKNAINQVRQALIDEASVKFVTEKKEKKLDEWVNLEEEKQRAINQVNAQADFLKERKKILESQLSLTTDDLMAGNLRREIEATEKALKPFTSSESIKKREAEINKIEKNFEIKKSKILAEIEGLEKSYKSAFKEVPSGGGNKDIKQVNNEIESLKKSLLTKETLLNQEYEKNKKLINQTVKDDTEKNSLLSELEKTHQSEMNNLKKDSFEEELDLLSKKKELGIMSYDELKQKVDEYYKWVKETYSKDSKEYIQALALKHNTDLRYGQEKQAEIKKQADDLQNQLERTKKLFEADIISPETLNQAIFSYREALWELGLDADDLQERLSKLDQVIEELSKEKGFNEKIKEMSETIRWFGTNTTQIIQGLNQSIEGAFGNVLSEVIVNHKSFGKQMTQVWKNLRIAIIQQIEAILVKMALLRILGFISGNPIGWGAAFSSSVSGFAEGGYFQGKGGAKEDKNLVLLSNGEYIINAEKTSYLKPFLDFLNYAPMTAVRSAIGSLNVPSIPALPQVAYASGGMVAGGFDMSGLESKLDKVVDRLERLEKKDYHVVVNAKFKGVEFAREIQRAQKIYQEVIK